MLRSIKEITGQSIEATDGKIGKIKSALYDDEFWTLRYIVLDTHRWLLGKKVLISPLHLGQPHSGEQGADFRAEISKQQIEDAPLLDEDAPVSRQYETEYAQFYGHPFYWTDPYTWGPLNSQPVNVEAEEERLQRIRRIEKSHLRSTDETIGYSLFCRSEKAGYIDDFILDTDRWRLTHVVIASHKWLPSQKTLIDINWIDSFDYGRSAAETQISAGALDSAPAFDPHRAVNRDFLNNLYDYHGKPVPIEETELTK